VPSWFKDDLTRGDAAASLLKRALPKALKAIKDRPQPAPIELYDPHRHHGLEQREAIQTITDRALSPIWPALSLTSTAAALIGCVVLNWKGLPHLIWSPLLSQIIAIVCGLIWASRIRRRVPMDAFALSEDTSSLRRRIHAFLRVNGDLWEILHSTGRESLAEDLLYYGSAVAALLGTLSWLSVLIRSTLGPLTWNAKLGCIAVGFGLVLWLGFLFCASRAISGTDMALGPSEPATSRSASQRSVVTAIWVICCVVLGIAALLFALPLKQSKGVSSPVPQPATVAKESLPIIVGVNDFGGAYPLLLANDGPKPGPRSLFKQRGLDVEVRWVKGSKERLQNFDRGEIQFMLLTLDYLAQIAPRYRDEGREVQAFLLVDWSRGNAGIVAKPEFSTIESLKREDVRIGTTQHTPTHYLLLYAMENSSLSPEEKRQIQKNISWVQKTPEANRLFVENKVNVLVTWEPYLSQAVQAGGRVLLSTEAASYLLADVLFARRSWLEQHREQVADFLVAYFQGLKQMEADPERMVAMASSEPFKQSPELARSVLKKIKWANFADNRDFFSLEYKTPPAGYQIPPYDHLYRNATQVWQSLGVLKSALEPEVTKWGYALERLSREQEFSNEKPSEVFNYNPRKFDVTQPILTKPVSIYFDSNSSELGPEAKEKIDGIVSMLRVMQDSYVRVEGNTDSLGSRRANILLSEKRAAVIVDYLVKAHHFDRARFLAVGNGPDKAVGDNSTPQGREQNRRTDFVIEREVKPAVSAPAVPGRK